jgi:hypothetical protein
MNLSINAVTMTSLELVEFINASRDVGASELRHDHFMTKVPQVLGQDNAPKFLGTQTYGNNNIRSIYNFSKREACLMAMSYSYDLQAKVFDRMTELEQANKLVLPAHTNIPILEKLNIIEKAKLTLGNEDTKQLFPLIWQSISDGIQNDIVAMFGNNTPFLKSNITVPLDIVEIAKRNNITIPPNLKSSVGKYVKANSSVPSVVTERVINGSIRQSNAYTNYDEIVKLIKQKLNLI